MTPAGHSPLNDAIATTKVELAVADGDDPRGSNPCWLPCGSEDDLQAVVMFVD
uniref:Uncharacterized protein n=1 Tax=Arundo donax TaxID=35708 RepID=A0A0A8YYJ5_ARUDO